MKTDQFTVSYSVNAAEVSPAMMEQDMMEEDTMKEDTMMEEDTMKEDTMMEEVMSPLQQMKSGVKASDVICKAGLEIIFKAIDGSAVCVTSSTASTLIQRGWATQ
jgi:pentapeptide MXKDX repeat protein